ncbi:MAG: hypothetical protein HQ523_06950 [Lentisphaerae bacterium]|nr:hypothetical protein [Lentisphaerota bacterium]
MKSLIYKNSHAASGAVLLLLVAALLPSGSAWAAGAIRTNSVAYAQDFEGIGEGVSIVSASPLGWSGSDTNFAVVVTTNNTSSSFPLEASAHTKVAKLQTDGNTITNILESVDDKIWIDMGIQMVPSDATPESFTNDTEVQVAMFLNASSNLVVYHGTMDGGYALGTSNVYTVLDHPAIEAGSWHRLTVEMDYESANTAFGPGYYLEFFRVLLDGTAISNALCWDDPGILGTLGGTGTWFVCANPDDAIERDLNATSLSGTGYFDDFVVTNGPVSYSVSYTIAASVSPAAAGSIDPGSSNTTSGANATFTITPAAYWDITNAVQDGVTSAWSSTSYTWSNVTANGSLVIQMDAQRSVSNVPIWWLAAMNTSTNGDDDTDSDGRKGWEEWLLQSDPDDSNSVGQVTVTVTNGSNVVSYTADGMVDPELPPLKLDRSTNLLSGLVEEADIDRSPSGTKTWVEALTDAFYRVRGTN